MTFMASKPIGYSKDYWSDIKWSETASILFFSICGLFHWKPVLLDLCDTQCNNQRVHEITSGMNFRDRCEWKGVGAYLQKLFDKLKNKYVDIICSKVAKLETCLH